MIENFTMEYFESGNFQEPAVFSTKNGLIMCFPICRIEKIDVPLGINLHFQKNHGPVFVDYSAHTLEERDAFYFELKRIQNYFKKEEIKCK